MVIDPNPPTTPVPKVAFTTAAATQSTTPHPEVTCDDEPRQNGAECIMSGNEVFCSCKEGFEGDYCEISKCLFCMLLSVFWKFKFCLGPKTQKHFFFACFLQHFPLLNLEFSFTDCHIKRCGIYDSNFIRNFRSSFYLIKVFMQSFTVLLLRNPSATRFCRVRYDCSAVFTLVSVSGTSLNR